MFHAALRNARSSFNVARETAHAQDKRISWHGAVGVRPDGPIVKSRNSPVIEAFKCAHAEARVCKKLNSGSTVYVVRIGRTDGKLRLSKPCKNCERTMRLRGVKKCYYSITEGEYGCINFT